MSIYHDGLVLSHRELSALLALGGKMSFYGYVPEEAGFTEDQLWNICCDLVAEGMMTERNGRFQLREDLFHVLIPLLEAEHALILRAGKVEPEVIYYLGEHVIAVEPTTLRGYSLCALEQQDFFEDLMNRSCIAFHDVDNVAATSPPVSDFNLQATVEQMLGQGDFLLTQVSLASGRTEAGLRGSRQAAERWLEVARKDEAYAVLLTQENLRVELLRMIKDVTQ